MSWVRGTTVTRDWLERHHPVYRKRRDRLVRTWSGRWLTRTQRPWAAHHVTLRLVQRARAMSVRTL